MPFFRYFCDSCQLELKKLQSKPSAEGLTCKGCSGPVRQVMTSPMVEEVVTIDEYKGKKRDPKAANKAYERAQEHYRKHEIPRIVEEKGAGFAMKEGIIKYDGTPLKGRSKT